MSGRGAAAVGAKRSRVIVVRVTPEERQRIIRAFQGQRGRSVGESARELMLEAAASRAARRQAP